MLMTVCEYNIGRGDYYCRIASDPEADPWIIGSTEMDAFVCGIGTPLLVSVEALGEGVTVYSSHGVVLEGDEYIPCSLAAPNEADEEDASWGSIRYAFLLTIIGSIQCPIFDLAVRKQLLKTYTTLHNHVWFSRTVSFFVDYSSRRIA